MKFLLLALLSLSLNAFANNDLDDLGVIGLQVDGATTEPVVINYPGHRMGGGTSPRMRIADCLILDIQDTDRAVTVAQKLRVAKLLRVRDGLIGRQGANLAPAVKDQKVVFYLKSGGMYVTAIQVESVSGDDLRAVLTAAVGAQIPVDLIYVRGCRL
jgi:hypothetical protein